MIETSMYDIPFSIRVLQNSISLSLIPLVAIVGDISLFFSLIYLKQMLEYAQYAGNYYGTNRKRVLEALESGKNVLLEIEPQGALQVNKVFPEAVLIFVLPPSANELKRRLVERGRESAELIEERLQAAKWEIEQCGKYDCCVVNDDLEECVQEVCAIFRKKVAEQGFAEKLLSELN